MNSTPNIPGYSLASVLGSGAMGTVYQAEQHSLGRQVAIKLMGSELSAEDPQFADRFLREARTLAELNHPHIVKIFDAGTIDDQEYLVMEYLPGGSLSERIANGLAPEQACTIFEQCAEALDQAHGLGYIHRDIKPDNILFRRADVAVVSDFGIVRNDDSALTKAGAVMGTPIYMSPQQARGEDLDGRSDQYSLGVVLYEMLSGRPPFRGADTMGTLMQHLTEAPPPLPAARQALQPVIDRLLAKSPEERFPTCSAAARALREALGPVSSLQSTGGPPGQSMATGHRTTKADSTSQPTVAPASSSTSAAAGRRMMWRALPILSLVLAIVAAAVFFAIEPATQPAQIPARVAEATERSVAVLPFDVLSTAAEDGFLGAGLHDTLLTELARIDELRVISRTSVQRYVDSALSLGEIGAELGVANLVEGSVQRFGERMRVNVQLIAGATDEHLWAEVYDRRLDDLFAVQADMAQSIARAIKITLSPQATALLQRTQNTNPIANAAYLEARAGAHSAQPDVRELALAAAERAVQIEPEFAEAQALLAILSSRRIHRGIDTSQGRQTTAREAAQAAARLAPTLGESLFAQAALAYYLDDDRQAALGWLNEAHRQLPGDADVIRLRAEVQRHLGLWEDTLRDTARALELDPLNEGVWLQHLTGLFDLRRYGEAQRVAGRALGVLPNSTALSHRRAESLFAQYGDTAVLRDWLEVTTGRADNTLCDEAGRKFSFYLLLKRPDSAQALVQSCAREVIPFAGGVQVSRQFFLGQTLLYGDDSAGARDAFESAFPQLKQRAEEFPGNAAQLAYLALAEAYLGNNEAAITLSKRALALAETRADPVLSNEVRRLTSIALAEAGEVDAAIALVQDLIGTPAGLVANVIATSPRWGTLQERPSFRAALAERR